MTQETAVKDEAEAAILQGLLFFETHHKSRSKIRAEWREKAGQLMDAHLFGVSASIGMINRNSGKPAKSDATISNRLALTAAFVQGIDLCEDAISEGLYVQAAALLKQEIETIAALQELKKGQRKEGKTPNVSHVPASMSVLYGQLNEVAHVGKADVLNQIMSQPLSPEVTGTSVIPNFREDVAFRYYGMHVTFVLQNALEIDELVTELYGEGKTEVEERMISRAFEILVSAGWLEVDNGAPKAVK